MSTERPVHHPESSWYTVGRDGHEGPFDATELAQKLDQGELDWSDTVWREGMRSVRPARRDGALVVAVANARGAAPATMRIDTPLLGMNEQEPGPEPLPEEDTLVDAIPAGLASTWPVRPGWPGAPRPNRSQSLARALKFTTLAVLAFVGGGLLVAIAGRVVTLTQSTPVMAHAAPTLPVAQAAVVPTPPSSLTPPSSGELVKRTLPALDEVRAELRRLGPSVRRCVRDPKAGIELDVTVAGETGRPRQIDVRTPRLTPGMIECTKAAVQDLAVAPFTASELAYSHRYAW